MQMQLFLIISHRMFVDTGIKINGAYYQDVLLKQEMLPDICAISGDFFIFPAGQCSDPYCPRDGRVTTARSSGFHCSKSVASQQPRPQPC